VGRVPWCILTRRNQLVALIATERSAAELGNCESQQAVPGVRPAPWLGGLGHTATGDTLRFVRATNDCVGERPSAASGA
jgi:hypothetical protein